MQHCLPEPLAVCWANPLPDFWRCQKDLKKVGYQTRLMNCRTHLFPKLSVLAPGRCQPASGTAQLQRKHIGTSICLLHVIRDSVLTPKAFANSSPGFERQRQPWDTETI